MPNKLEVHIPKKLEPLYTNTKRFVVVYGGRGGSKSWGISQYLILRAYKEPIRILCCREIQASIAQSSHKLLCDTIDRLGLSSFFEITDKTIKGKNGSEIFFKGLYNNHDSIKSLENITICSVDEAQSISRTSIEVLVPTIRAKDSMIIFGLNPDNETDVVYADYIIPYRSDTLKIEINYNDNPWFPESIKQDMEYCRATDPDKFAHIWLGKCIKHSEAQVFYGKWKIKQFELPEDTIYYYGMDLGFAQDPSIIIKSAIVDKDLYVVSESGGIGIEITKLHQLFDKLNINKQELINADCSRPETISHIKKIDGYNIVGQPKLKIEDGIEYIRSFENIYIHADCKETIDEFRLYCYKIDPHSGLITNNIIDKHNHYIDGLRYSLYNCIKKKSEYATVLYY